MKKFFATLPLLFTLSSAIQTTALPSYLTYSVSAINPSTSPTTYTFTFSTPILPTGPLTMVSSTLSGSLTDVAGDGASLSPIAGETTLQNSFVSSPQTSLGVDMGPGVAYGSGSPGAVYSYGAYSIGPQIGPNGIWTELSLTLSFTLSGGDLFSANGRLEIESRSETAVPDGGSTIMLLGLGMAGLALIRRRLN